MSLLVDSAYLDARHEILTSPYRRRILLAVSDDASLAADDVTTEVFDSSGADGDDPDTLRLKLTHTHLPKLAKNGYIEWDSDAMAIRRGPNFDDIAPLLGVISAYTDGVTGTPE